MKNKLKHQSQNIKAKTSKPKLKSLSFLFFGVFFTLFLLFSCQSEIDLNSFSSVASADEPKVEGQTELNDEALTEEEFIELQKSESGEITVKTEEEILEEEVEFLYSGGGQSGGVKRKVRLNISVFVYTKILGILVHVRTRFYSRIITKMVYPGGKKKILSRGKRKHKKTTEYPKHIKLNKKIFNKMWDGHGGPNAKLPDAPDNMQCAINFSFGLFKDTSKPGGTVKGNRQLDIEAWRKYINKHPKDSQGDARPKANGGGYARTTWTEFSKWDKDAEGVLAAIDLADWFKDEVFGEPKVLKTKSEQKAMWNTMQGKKYIVFFLHPVNDYISESADHIDIWDGSEFKRAGGGDEARDLVSEGANQMWLWEVK